MRSTAQTIEKLLQQLVDSSSWVEEYDAQSEVSPFLAGSFTIYRAELLSKEVFFAEDTDGEGDYGALRKRLDQLTSALRIPHGEQVVLFSASLPPNVRRSFLETGTPFVTADGDMYIPFLSFRINARRQSPVSSVRPFRSSDQSVFLFCLYAEGGFTQEDVMQATSISVGSVSRALTNLVAARALDFETGGRTRRMKTYYRADNRIYYQVGLEFFGDAVQSTAFTNAMPRGEMPLASGLSALAHSSDLLAPSKRVWAIGPKRAGDIVLTDPDPYRGFQNAIQVLRYDPTPFARDGQVDPFTMLMTIPRTDRNDERVRIALREALGECAWYQD